MGSGLKKTVVSEKFRPSGYGSVSKKGVTRTYMWERRSV